MKEKKETEQETLEQEAYRLRPEDFDRNRARLECYLAFQEGLTEAVVLLMTHFREYRAYFPGTWNLVYGISNEVIGTMMALLGIIAGTMNLFYAWLNRRWYEGLPESDADLPNPDFLWLYLTLSPWPDRMELVLGILYASASSTFLLTMLDILSVGLAGTFYAVGSAVATVYFAFQTYRSFHLFRMSKKIKREQKKQGPWRDSAETLKKERETLLGKEGVPFFQKKKKDAENEEDGKKF